MLTQEETRAFFAQYAHYRRKRTPKGLAMAVALAKTNRPLYDSIQGTTIDPASDDSRIPAFRTWLGV